MKSYPWYANRNYPMIVHQLTANNPYTAQPLNHDSSDKLNAVQAGNEELKRADDCVEL